ncbi:MAG: PEP-CTERM sorting domain-containing protein [Akkermansiaceae bacterium]
MDHFLWRRPIPFQEFNNNQLSASATLNGVFFEVVPIPEPGAIILVMFGLLGFWRRTRL